MELHIMDFFGFVYKGTIWFWDQIRLTRCLHFKPYTISLLDTRTNKIKARKAHSVLTNIFMLLNGQVFYILLIANFSGRVSELSLFFLTDLVYLYEIKILRCNLGAK